MMKACGGGLRCCAGPWLSASALKKDAQEIIRAPSSELCQLRAPERLHLHAAQRERTYDKQGHLQKTEIEAYEFSSLADKITRN